MLKYSLLLLLTLLSGRAIAQSRPVPLSQQMADSFMKWYPDSLGLTQNKAARWGYEHGLMLKSIERVWQRTGQCKYLDYIVRTMDYSLPEDGSTIRRHKAEDFNLDNTQTPRKGYAGIVKNFVQNEPDGTLALTGTVGVDGLGSSPYRDGSYDYYLSEPLKKNDFKGVGPFIMASVELETMPPAK